jgi:predicted ABC-type ATPase
VLQVKEKWMWIVTGPNGAGKSSYRATMSHPMVSMPYINPDDMAKDHKSQMKAQGIMVSEEDAISHALLAIPEIMNRFTSSGTSFIVETTVPGKSYTEKIRQLKKEGWKIGIIAIGIATPELAVSRVRKRVMEGGHPVWDDVTETRWEHCADITPSFLTLADTCEILDNSGEHIKTVARRKTLGSEIEWAITPEEIEQNPYLNRLKTAMHQGKQPIFMRDNPPPFP